MTKRILTTSDNGVTIAVITPAPEVTVEHCIKDVQTGEQYKIVDVEVLPTDRDFRDAWEVTPDETWSTK